MGVINVLEKNVAELIAAGEVIERPASIVKELLENSIDAKSTAITIEIRHGGISYIRITDNGIGISKEDMPIAFLRHATSKIFNQNDLDNIATLGFRGEALASVAAVSRVELISKRKQDQYGNRIFLEGSELVDSGEIGCPDGTTIIVSDLFYNVPARLKFLKKDISEANAIAGIVDKIALSHPEISFKLISDNKLRLHSPGNNDLLSSVHSVFGKEFATNLIKVDYSYNGMRVSGYTSNTRNPRSNRAMQHFFINNRYVKSKTCMVAVEEAYKNSIMVGKYPYCILNIEVPYDTVDVNVHPAKIEVRFTNEKTIFEIIYFAIKSALSNDDILKKASTKQTTNFNLTSTFKNQESSQINITNYNNETVKNDDSITISNENPAPTTYYKDMNFSVKEKLSVKDDVKLDIKRVSKENENEPQKVLKPKEIELQNDSFSYINTNSFIKKDEEKQEEINQVVNQLQDTSIEETIETNEPINIRIIGELFKTYILFEVSNSLLLLDKHAAHERILFEELKLSVKTDRRQILLKPILVNTSNEEYQALTENELTIKNLGFDYEEFGNNAFMIREVPLVLAECDLVDIFLNIANNLLDNKKDISSDIYEDLLHSIACRSAIKANDINNIKELEELVKMVYQNDEIRHCPHGRPVIIEYTKSQIEKQFGRI